MDLYRYSCRTLPRETAFTLEMPVESVGDILHDYAGGVTLQLKVMDVIKPTQVCLLCNFKKKSPGLPAV